VQRELASTAFPDNLSAAIFDDLEACLQLSLKKAKRRAV
jgi:hypothetical protein